MSTLRLFIWSDKLISDPDRWRVLQSDADDRFYEVPRNMDSVLSGLSCSPLRMNHWRTATTTRSVTSMDCCFSCVTKDIYIWVSSAYWWCCSPAFSIMFATGDTWRANKNGPRTDPYSTPNIHGNFSEVELSILWSSMEVWSNLIESTTRYTESVLKMP